MIFARLSVVRTMDSVERLKADGNASFAAEKWEEALAKYSEAISLAEALPGANTLLATLLSNRSAVWAMLERHSDALFDANKVMTLRPDWPRGYARRAVALTGLNRLPEAHAALKQGLQVDPGDSMLLELTEHLDADDDRKRKAPEGVTTFAAALKHIRDAGVERGVSVVVLSGFLGAGKTTLLNWMLRQNDGRRKFAVLVNDMAAINVDAELLRTSADHHAFSEVTEELVELTNGCVCCTLRADLIEEATRLLCTKRFDALVIEATGISEPMPVAATFTAEDFHGATLREYFTLDNMVTLVDASEFLERLNKGATLKEEKMEATEEDSRTVGELLADQVEFAYTLILNKCDLVSRERVEELRALLTRMNPTAHLVEAVKSEVQLEEIIDTKRFRLARAQNFDGFATELASSHPSETEEFGISSFVFTSPKPFHPVRLHRLLFGDAPNDERHFAEDSPLGKAYRSKGWFYLANALRSKLTWSGAGRSVQFEVAAERWLASMLPEHLWPLDDEDWQPLFGDRAQKIVIIGPSTFLPSIKESLQATLLTDEEVQNPESWRAMDCSRVWELEESSDEEESEKSVQK